MSDHSFLLDQPHLFLDDRWVDDAAFVTRTWHQPRKFPQPVLTAEHAWEQWCPTMFGSVLYWRGAFHMWYVTWSLHSLMRACYASSRDGVKWEKPNLGLYDYEGSRHNNIVLQSDVPGSYIDNLTVIDDPDDEEWPLKMLLWDGHYAGGRPAAGTGIHAARSKDGIHWDRSPGLVLDKWNDRFNAAPCKVDGKYVLLGRVPGNLLHGAKAGAFDKGRAVWRTESPDLVHWSPEELVLAADAEDPEVMQYYSAMAFPYGDLLLGGIERMNMAPDWLDVELVWSYDHGRNWQRARQRPRFIELGQPGAFDHAWIALNTTGAILHHGPLPNQSRLWFYYSGRSHAHGAAYPLNHGGIGLAVLRTDGFASLHASEQWGYVMTPLLIWPQGSLQVNSDPRRETGAHIGYGHGALQVEVRGENDAPLEGFAWDDCEVVSGNTLNLEDASAPVVWKNGKDIRQLAGQKIRLVFRLRDCHLYSFRAVS